MLWATLGLLTLAGRLHGQLAASGNDISLYYLSAYSIQDQYIRPMAAYSVAPTDTVVDWLLDGVILYDQTLYFSSSPLQINCSAYINNLFTASNQVAALDTLIGGLKAQLGTPSYKWQVVLAVPVAQDAMTTTNTVANCATLLNDWHALNPANLQLDGFYWGYSEAMTNSGDMAICQAAANYIHANGLKLFWIPYNWAPGVSNWGAYGMDYVTQQPNYMKTSPPYSNDFVNVETDIANWGLQGVELEFQNVRSGLGVVQSAHDYLDYAERYGWNDLFLTTYYEEIVFNSFARYGAIEGQGIYERLYRYISPSVRAQWRFSEASGTVTSDTSCHTNNGTLYGATWVNEGMGSALHCNGISSYMECPENPSLDINGSITLEAWIKPEALPSSYAQIVGRSSGTNRMLLRTDGAIVVQMGASSLATAGSLIAANQWYHVIYASNGTNSAIYVNGVAAATGSAGGGFGSTYTVRVGMSSSTYPFQGVIDEVKIYSRALTAAEAFLNYQEGLDILDLRGGWSFEEGTGTNTYDFSIATPPASIVYGALWDNDAAAATCSSLHFNGTTADYLAIQNSAALNITGALALEAWIKPMAFTAPYAQVVGRSENDQRMLLDQYGGILVQMGGGTSHQTSSNAVPLNQWSHIVYTSNGTNSAIYVNGAQVGPAGTGGANFSSSAPVWIGKAANDTYSFNGLIDELHIYARSLTPTEVLTRYSPTLMAHWQFNEGAGNTTSDASGHGNTGAIYGGTAWVPGVNPAWMAGANSGSALHFNGMASNYVEFQDNPALNIAGALTMEAWIMPESFTIPYAQIVGRSENDRRMLVDQYGGILVQMGGGTSHQTASNAVALNQWNHIAYTSNGTNSAIYVNGTQVGSNGTGGANFTSTAPIWIGMAVGNTYAFKGTIDEVGVYNRVLSPAEISQQYNPSLRGQWRFNEGAGSTASDTSGHNNTGTIIGASWTNPGVNYALYFDGNTNNWVDIMDNPSLDIYCDLTLVAWIKPESVPSLYAQIVGRSAYGQRMMLENNGAIVVNMGNTHQTPASLITMDGNHWYHVVYTSDGVTSYVYINGVQAGSSGNGGADFRSAAPVRIGKTIANYYPFQGTIDEVNIYATVLSPATVAARYRAGRGADPYPSSSLPIITTQPQGQTLIGGAIALFSVAATSTTPLNYQWSMDASNIAGATNAILVLTNINRPASGVYSLIVSNSVGAVLSSNAVLRVLVPQRLSGPEMMPDETFQFFFGDSDGNPMSLSDAASFEVLSSTNLLNWLPSSNSLSLSNGLLLFRDSNGANNSCRFYRVLEQ